MPGASTRTSSVTRPPADDPVASRIRTLRLGLGWSLKRLSEASGGLAPSFLFNIENGRKVPSPDVAARIALALGDGEHEETYRAWARAKSRGRTGRMDHEAMLEAWEQLRHAFGGAASETRAAERAEGARELGRLRVPVLASATDPGDAVRPPAELVVNTLSIDPQAYGQDAPLARERFARLQRPFAFPLDPAEAARVGCPRGYLVVVSREPLAEPLAHALYVLRQGGRLEVLTGAMLGGESSTRERVLGRVDLLIVDVRA